MTTHRRAGARLANVDLPIATARLPRRIRDLLMTADELVERFTHDHRDRPVAAFVPCDFVLAYQAIERISELNLAPGGRFVEWGSGLGAVTCLASLLGFDAVGIEIEPDLVEDSESLAEQHECDAQFVCGSFVPPGAEETIVDQHDITWLRSDGADAYDWLDLEPDDFDLVFNYPWPGEEQLVFDLFAQYGAVGALLLTYHGQDGVRLQRKVR